MIAADGPKWTPPAASGSGLSPPVGGNHGVRPDKWMLSPALRGAPGLPLSPSLPLSLITLITLQLAGYLMFSPWHTVWQRDYILLRVFYFFIFPSTRA